MYEKRKDTDTKGKEKSQKKQTKPHNSMSKADEKQLQNIPRKPKNGHFAYQGKTASEPKVFYFF